MSKKKKTKVKLKKKKSNKVKKKQIFKKKVAKENKKNQSISVSNQNEILEIKKIKKQETQKRIYKVKDFVVYPKHGIGQIISVEKDTIAGIEISFYRIEITKDKLILTIPTNQQGNLRALSSINQINKSISILKGKAKVKRTMWSRRAQEYEQKINSGEIYQIAEVVRDLNKNTDMPVDQSYSERQLFEKAYDRLLGEVIAVLNINEEAGKVKLNKALGKKPEEINNPTSV